MEARRSMATEGSFVMEERSKMCRISDDINSTSGDGATVDDTGRKVATVVRAFSKGKGRSGVIAFLGLIACET